MPFNLSRLWKRIRRMNFITLVIFAAVVVLLSTTVIYSIEPKTFGNLFNAYWWTMTTVMTVGYGDYFPKTIPGKAFTIHFVYYLGIGIWGMFIAKIADNFMYYQRLEEEGRMKFTGKNHYVIVGWTSKTVNLIEEFLAANKKAEIVLIDRLSRTPLTHRQVHYIQGDATDEEILLKANVLEAKTVSVLSNESLSHGDADARTLMIATTIEGLSKQRDKSVYTIVEVMKENNIKKFEHAKVDEYVTSSDTVAHIMAQAAIHNGSSEFFRELASKESGENLYEIQAKSYWITYKDAMLELLEHEAILLWDKDRKAINGILNEKIPPQSTLFFMSTNESYKKIVQGEKEKKNATNIQKDINKTLAKSID